MTTALIQDDATLRAACDRWAQSAWLCLDTEFVRVDTYHARLCLLQVSDGVTAACVDPLAPLDLNPLLDLIYAPSRIKVLHAPGQDLEILVRLRGHCPQPLFDSQTAATLLGIGDQIGYAGLIEKRLGIVLDKSLSRTDWARRPLREAELAYAVADVSHLATIYAQLQDELAAAGRLAWLAEDCARLCEPAQYQTRPEDAWERLKGLARMNPREQTVAAALADWREREAQARDRPRKWILEDDAIYRMAERRPATLGELEALRVLPPKTLERHGERLLAVVAQASAAPEHLYARDEEFDAAQKQKLKQLQDLVQARASTLNLPASFLAARADLVALVRAGALAQSKVLRGWRREVCGEALLLQV
ncbi:MAG TPA: ribonuclease D [Solimonas sp.]|nr:ribonuclease D [Solimonas sp.]